MTRTSSKKNRVFQHSRARKTFPLSYSVVLIQDGSGKIMGAVAANRDIPTLKSSASMIASDRQLL